MSQVGNNLSYTKDYNTSLIYFNSADKTLDSASNTNFNISFVSTGNALSKVKKLTMTSFSCNNLFNNVASYNNIFALYYRFQAGPSVPVLPVIPPNYYNATQLCAIIQAYVRDLTPMAAFTCVFDTTTFKITVASNDPDYELTIANNILNGGFRQRLEGALAWNMGYTQLPVSDVSITADSLPQLNQQAIYIYSTKLASVKGYRSNGSNQSTITNLLLSIPLYNIAYGSTVNWLSVGGENQRGDTFYSIENQLDTIDFKLCDTYGNILEAPNNNVITMEFFSHY
jgi:hypothetical protein